MDLYSLSKNIRQLDIECLIKECIRDTKEELNGLTSERTCMLYSSYLYEKLKANNIPARIISTIDLGYNYEHRFILVPNNLDEKEYYLIDLTFNQFLSNDENIDMFNKLLIEGYQKITDILWIFYLSKIVNEEAKCSLGDAFYKLPINTNKSK